MNLTTEPLTKLLPVMASVNAGSPNVAVVCERLLSVGTGLLTVKLTLPEAPPPGAGLTTTTENVPAVATSAAVIWAVNWVLPTKFVVRSLPLNFTTAPLTKLLPLTVSVRAGSPAMALVEERLLMVGAG